jgi:hypothetical protein
MSMVFFALLFVNLRAHSPSPLATPAARTILRFRAAPRILVGYVTCKVVRRRNDSLRIEVQADYQVGSGKCLTALWADHIKKPAKSAGAKSLA